MQTIRYYLHIILILLAGMFTQHAVAQGFSYVYIQGDKQIPFYVKMEGEMLPRYGKNYSIISELAPGPINIEILFQQNAFPAEKFVIKVPENGFRGFLMVKKDGVYALYDIHQRYYLMPGNKAEDDHLSSATSNVYVTTTTATPPSGELSAGNTKAITTPKKINNNKSGQPRFIEDIELNNERTVAAENTVKPGEVPEPEQAEYELSGPPIMNSDCPEPIQHSEYEDIYKRASQKSDKSRLKYLIDKLDKCYSTGQVRGLAETLDNDPERYTYFKRAYPRTTDQQNFPVLENMLTTDEWKGYFRLILPE